MSITNELIKLQSSKEKAAFVSLLSKRNKRHDTKNVQLYRDIISGKEKKLLSIISPNAYNALKKRLTDLLIEFSAMKIKSLNMW